MDYLLLPRIAKGHLYNSRTSDIFFFGGGVQGMNRLFDIAVFVISTSDCVLE